MTISSRTPEGDPNQCPICGHHVRLEPSIDTRDAPCPSCGYLLWFARPSDGSDKWAAKARISELATKQFGPPPEDVRVALDRMAIDKFEKVELNKVRWATNWDAVVVLVQFGK